MSYQVLARKWRPRSFAELVGQGHVVRPLRHALSQDKLHHALLLSGTRGVGKTTLARIIARCLNCEKGVSPEPCGTCTSCREVDEGRFVDLIEIDAASRTGVDDVREMQDNVQYAPTRGRRKVYLIDEVHMFSKNAFNALLKTLEEPPPRVQFILATTDPQKLPVTILSRCLQFHLKRVPSREIQGQLKRILEAEKIGFEPAAVASLARAADGSLRDSLSLLDQAIAFGAGTVRETEVQEMLGTLSRRDVLSLLRAISGPDVAGLYSHLRQLDEKAPDYEAVLEDVAALLQRVALLQLVPTADLDEDDETLGALRELAEKITPEDAQLFYQVALAGRRDLEWAPDPASGVEMTLLRMVAFRPDGGGLKPAGSIPSARRQTTSAAAGKPSAPDSSGAQQWDEFISGMDLKGMLGELARNCAWVARSGDVVRVRLDPQHHSLLTEALKKRLEQSLQGHFGPSTKLEIETRGGGESPAEKQQRFSDDLKQRAEQSIAADPVVRELQARFGARVRPGSVEPVDPVAAPTADRGKPP